MITYVSGTDTFSKNKYINELVGERERVEFNTAVVDLGYIMSQLLIVDLFAVEKVYIFTNFKGFSNKSEKYNRTDSALLGEIFNCDEDIIISSEKGINHSTIWFKKFSDKIIEKEFNLEQFDFDQGIANYIAENNITISENALEMIKHNFQGNIFGATNDIAKLWNYTNFQEISDRDVLEAGQQMIEHKVFELYNLVTSGNTSGATLYLDKLRLEGVEDADILLISITQFTRMLEVKILLEMGMNEFQIAKQLKVSPFVIKQMRKVVAHTSMGRLENIVLKIAEFDYQFKSGQALPAILNDLLIIK